MNFTKEYIAKTNCKDIQGLRKTVDDFKMGDYFYDIAMKINPIFIIGRKDKAWCREEIIWLPTGDQLDDEIVKICGEKELTIAMYYSFPLGWEIDCENTTTSDETIYDLTIKEDNINLAKIKLLKALLKESNG